MSISHSPGKKQDALRWKKFMFFPRVLFRLLLHLLPRRICMLHNLKKIDKILSVFIRVGLNNCTRNLFHSILQGFLLRVTLISYINYFILVVWHRLVSVPLCWKATVLKYLKSFLLLNLRLIWSTIRLKRKVLSVFGLYGIWWYNIWHYPLW